LDSKWFASLKDRIAGNTVKNCEPFRDLLEAYALGALDPAERSTLEAHLATGCQDCARALAEARWLVSQLAYLSPEATPSDMLKGRLMQTVRPEARSSPSTKPAKPAVPFWLWAGVAALLLLTFYSSWNAWQVQIQVRRLNDRAAAEIQNRRRLEQELAAARREAIILTDPASVKLALSASDPQFPQLEARWHSQLGIVVSGQKISVPPGNRVLQLWLIPKAAGGKPIASLTLRPDADGKFVLLVATPPELMAETKALAITEEPAGGSAQPTSAPRWVGGVS
jgi:anti-sigma-K factor RskA